MEKELRKRSNQDTAPSRLYKKRHLKDLTADDIAAIVAASKEPYRLQVDIARQFKIS